MSDANLAEVMLHLGLPGLSGSSARLSTIAEMQSGICRCLMDLVRNQEKRIEDCLGSTCGKFAYP
jgi:hypothetical protein